MKTSNLVAETVWKNIESTRSGPSIFRFFFVVSIFLPVLILIFSVLFLLWGRWSFKPAVTDDQLSMLRATRIVDHRVVKRIFGEPCGRSIFQVMGESRRKEEYLCFAEHYCACYSFFYDIIKRGEQLCCKHLIAARLAASVGACIDVKVSDEELALLLSEL